jgi:hypothetical protein
MGRAGQAGRAGRAVEKMRKKIAREDKGETGW